MTFCREIQWQDFTKSAIMILAGTFSQLVLDWRGVDQMKAIENFTPSKYSTDVSYACVADGIYKKGNKYHTCLSFIQEPAMDEGCSSASISQYPLEDILDSFLVHVTDSFPLLNDGSSERCYLEFASSDIKNIQALRKIIGKHVYNRPVSQDGDQQIELVIE